MPATATALDFFQLFVPDNCIQNMVVQTNMYAKKFQERFGSDESWHPVTAEEMKAFLGFVTSTSIHRCESVLNIWSSGFFSNRSIALKMSQSRFEKILKYFHIVAFRPSQGSNQGLYKIQPFLDSLQQSFSHTFRPSQTQVHSWRHVEMPEWLFAMMQTINIQMLLGAETLLGNLNAETNIFGSFCCFHKHLLIFC